ncbi:MULTISPECIES: fimbrial protein [Providencia]|uniref:fimbrial protein n=2 Tax=Morganellaceae TaxID=1903414 RepID=UPI000ADB1D85|nr:MULTISPECIES: fimbrial protein [Providencia]
MLSNNQIICAKLLGIAGLFLSGSGPLIADITHTNMGSYSFEGMVVVTPCQISPGSEKVPVNFEQVSVKELYTAGKSKPLPFSINLINCNISVFKAVTVTFNGTENINLPDHLAINAKSEASGIGIGLLNENNTEIKLNQPSLAQDLANNDTEIKFKAYIEVEPEALSNKAITYGNFYSTAYYTLEYQ